MELFYHKSKLVRDESMKVLAEFDFSAVRYFPLFDICNVEHQIKRICNPHQTSPLLFNICNVELQIKRICNPQPIKPQIPPSISNPSRLLLPTFLLQKDLYFY